MILITNIWVALRSVRWRNKPHTSIFSPCYVHIVFREEALPVQKMWFTSIFLSHIWSNIVPWQSCSYNSLHFCNVHFNVTKAEISIWLFLFVGMSSEFGKLPEVGLNDLLAHQLLSTNIGVVMISQKIVLYRVQLQMLRCCDSRKYYCVWEGFVLTFIYQISLCSAENIPKSNFQNRKLDTISWSDPFKMAYAVNSK